MSRRFAALMTGFDYFILALVAVSAASGASKGLTRSLVSFASAIVGLAGGVTFYDDIAKLYEWIGLPTPLTPALGFLTPVVVCIVGGGVLSNRIRKKIRRTAIAGLDTVGGAGLGVVRGWLIGSAVFLTVTAFPVKLTTVEKAVTTPALMVGARLFTLVAARDLVKRFEEGVAELRRLKTEYAAPPRKPTERTPTDKRRTP